MHWPFNYPGDSYITNVFSQIIVVIEEIKDTTVEILEEFKDELIN